VNSVPDDRTSNYSCSFGLSSLLSETEENDNNKPIYTSNATKYENHIECYSPPANTLSVIHQSMLNNFIFLINYFLYDIDSIFIRLFYNDIILAEKNITFYDCSSYLT
jgi:hypothetical protein